MRGICEKPRVKCGECPHQAFVAVTDNVIRCHLQGTDRDSSGRGSGSEYIAGVYPLLPDETCWFLAIDFDKQSWQIDARAFVDACRAHEIDAALPRSADAERDRRHSDFASDRVSTVKTLSRLTVKLAGARTRWDVEVANTTTRAFVPVAIYRGLLPSSEIF